MSVLGGTPQGEGAPGTYEDGGETGGAAGCYQGAARGECSLAGNLRPVPRVLADHLVPSYLIDQQPEKDNGSLPMMKLEDDLPATDLIIVTVPYDFPAIQRKLKEKVAAEICPINWLIDSVMNV